MHEDTGRPNGGQARPPFQIRVLTSAFFVPTGHLHPRPSGTRSGICPPLVLTSADTAMSSAGDKDLTNTGSDGSPLTKTRRKPQPPVTKEAIMNKLIKGSIAGAAGIA